MPRSPSQRRKGTIYDPKSPKYPQFVFRAIFFSHFWNIFGKRLKQKLFNHVPIYSQIHESDSDIQNINLLYRIHQQCQNTFRKTGFVRQIETFQKLQFLLYNMYKLHSSYFIFLYFCIFLYIVVYIYIYIICSHMFSPGANGCWCQSSHSVELCDV